MPDKKDTEAQRQQQLEDMRRMARELAEIERRSRETVVREHRDGR